MFSERLRAARTNAGLTQQQLGEFINTDKRMISKFEGNFCLPVERDLYIICNALKTTPLELDFPRVATAKTQVATARKAKTGVSVYKFCVRLRRADFSKLTKDNLQACGMNSYLDFMRWAYEQFCNQLKIIEINKK